MLRLDIDYNLLEDPLIEQLALHEDTRQIVFCRGSLIFIFNFHVSESYADLRIPISERTDYRVLLDTDSAHFGGQGLVATDQIYPWQDVPMYGREQSVQIYLPARSAQVLAPIRLSL